MNENIRNSSMKVDLLSRPISHHVHSIILLLRRKKLRLINKCPRLIAFLMVSFVCHF